MIFFKNFSSILLIIILGFFEISKEALTFPFETKKIPVFQTVNSFLELPKSKIVLYEERDCIEACFGNNKEQCFNLVIHGGSFHIWIVDEKSDQKIKNKFDPTKSSTLEKNMNEISATYGDDNVYGYQGTDYLWLSNQKIPQKISFLISRSAETFTYYEGMIGLGYTPSSYEEKYSILNQLYKQRLIFHRVFAQNFEESQKGEITFGEIPKNIVSDYKNYGRCDALDKEKGGILYKNKKWQCAIKGVFYGDKFHEFNVYKLDDHVSFFSYRKRALIPKNFFEYLEKTYFKELIDDRICESTYIKRYDTFLCNIDYEPSVDLNLIYGDWAMKLPGKNLFKVNKEKNKLEFIFTHKKDYEKWTLGRPIARMFHMVYDYDNEEIGFYSKDKVIRIAEGEATPPNIYTEILEDDSPKIVPKNSTQEKEVIKDIDAEIEEKGDPKGDLHTFSLNSTTVQIVLALLVVLGILFIILVTCYSWTKYRKFAKNKKLYLLEENKNIIL